MNIATPNTNNDLHAAAKLTYQSDKHFYNLFSNSEDENIKNILKMHEDDNTTFSKVKSVYVGNKMVGIILCYPASEIYMRQMFSLPYLAQGKEFDSDALREFGESVPTIKSDGLYLSNIAIDEEYQGKGLCKKFMNILFDLAIAEKKKEIVLYVRRDNLAAIKCYESSGFINKDEKRKYIYIALTKKLN